LTWTGSPPVRNQLAWFDREGKPQGTLGPPGPYSGVTLSPDGNQVAVSFAPASGRADISVMDVTRGVPSRLTFDDARHTRPVWSPDARWLAFSSDRGAAWDLYNVYRREASGGGEDQPLLKPGMSQVAEDVSSDGKLLLYAGQDPKTGSHLWVAPVGADAQPTPYLRTAANETAGRFAPNGSNSPRWVAYVSNESGRNEVVVQSFPAGGGKTQVSSDGGHGPRWSKNGDELFYVTSAGDLIAVQIKAGEKFTLGKSETLFRVRGRVGSDPENSVGYDVAPNGKRFLINIPGATQGAGSLPFNVVLNWQAGLRK
jgi:Tol biopolymer transport system component